MTSLAAFLARLEENAHTFRTRSPAGATVWRSWGEGPSMVLMHGNSGSWWHWACDIDRLGGRRRLNAVWGARDRFAGDTLPQRVAQLRAARPDADIGLIDEAGYWVTYEAAAAFNEYTLSRLPTGPVEP